jgi:hypothetical protein
MAGNCVEQIAHTLDITATGARLAAVRHELTLSSEMTVAYHQRKMTFLVVWVRQMGKNEYQVGLRAIRDEQRDLPHRTDRRFQTYHPDYS